ncbi:S-adenosyl-L-methionine-dependent methyltransferase [Syncephalis plumigaleata]|nr:S-adenosyl-L-methionine-dependent methyltransferase [Syncephalis plumigaleata]
MSSLPTVSYDSSDYWNERFREETQFEWLFDFEQLKPLLFEPSNSAIISAKDRVLHVGCGSSQLGVAMARYGCAQVINTDLSSIVIERGRTYSQTQLPSELNARLQWYQSDVTDMRGIIPDNSVDVILDKAVMDAIACGDTDTETSIYDGAGNAHPITGTAYAQMAEEAGRVLSIGGRWVVISCSSHRPVFQSTPLQQPSDNSTGWRWQSDPVRTIEAPFQASTSASDSYVARPVIHHYIYVHRKLAL